MALSTTLPAERGAWRWGQLSSRATAFPWLRNKTTGVPRTVRAIGFVRNDLEVAATNQCCRRAWMVLDHNFNPRNTLAPMCSSTPASDSPNGTAVGRQVVAVDRSILDVRDRSPKPLEMGSTRAEIEWNLSFRRIPQNDGDQHPVKPKFPRQRGIVSDERSRHDPSPLKTARNAV